MARKKFQTLSEPMFYILMALKNGNKCGIEIVEFINRRSGGRVSIGPGTLYALLSDFESEKAISYVGLDGKKKIYAISQYGAELYTDELARLKKCVSDGEAEDED